MKGLTLTVSQLNEYVRRSLASDPMLHGLCLTGELSNFKRHTSGHWYFTLKDEDIQFLKEEETTVDKLSAGITNYAIKLSALQISEKEHQDVAHLLQLVSDIERISDYCENISEFAETLYEKKVAFSEIGSSQ